MSELYDQIMWNKRKSYLYIAFFFVLIFVTAYAIGMASGYGEWISIIAILLAVVTTVGTYKYSDVITLKTVNARIAEKKEFPFLYNTVEGLAIAASIPMPRLYVIDDESVNAFATGIDPEHAIIVVNTGTLKKLNRLELEGVIGHEMAHIKNYDIKMMMLAAVMVGAVAIIANFGLRFGFRGEGGKGRFGWVIIVFAILLTILAPIFAKLVQMAISRKREYLADASGALLTKYPEGLASALEKIKKDSAPPMQVSDAVAPLFISNPIRSFSSWFGTHPPLEERIRLLRKM